MHPRQRSASVSFATFVTIALAAPATAQCGLQFHPGMGIPGVIGEVRAVTTWDHDGAGPLPPLLVIAGNFTEAGTLRANFIAAYDPATGDWSALGSGTSFAVTALAVAQNGDLFAGGSNAVARWDGTAWSALGAGFNGPVYTLAVMPNGDLVAGGLFTTAGGSPANKIARWDGASWSPLGAGMSGPPSQPVYLVDALTVLPNGDLIAGGTFMTAGGIAAPCLARWNGSTWSPMITTITNLGPAIVQSLAQMPNGDLVAAGQFTSIDGVAVANIARWNGTAWAPFGAGTDGWIGAMALLQNGDLVVGGNFTHAGGGLASRIARWDGTAWSPFGSGANDVVRAVAVLPSGDVVAGGLFWVLGGVPAAAVGRWNGAGWSALNAGPAGFGGADSSVRATAAMPNGDLVAGGWFSQIGGVAAQCIARWNGTSWSPLGTGISGGGVYALAAMPNGDVVAGGSFSSAGGQSAMRVARWNGTTWSPLGGGPDYLSVAKLVVLANGDLVAAGAPLFSGPMLARWNGTTWSPMAYSPSAAVNSLTLFPNGDLLIAGAFPSIDGVPVANLARWNGVTWSAIGSGTSGPVNAATAMLDGSVVAAGVFSSAGGIPVNGIARWDGLVWSPLGSGLSGVPGTNMALLPLPGGDLLFGGGFAMVGGVPGNRLARWDGALWTAFGPGCDGDVHGLLAMPNGDVVAHGAFLNAGGVTSARIARVSSTCPATVVGLGAGCTGSGGPNVLTATTLPWTGGTFRATATGMPALALVLSVYGFTPVSIPMASVLPQGLPGCDIQMVPDFIDVLLPAAGAVQTQLAVPDSVALAGLVLHHYVVPFEVDAALQVLAITSSNALTLTLGSF